MYFFSVGLYPIAASLVAGKANVSGPTCFFSIISPPSSRRRAHAIAGLLLLRAKQFDLPKLTRSSPGARATHVAGDLASGTILARQSKSRESLQSADEKTTTSVAALAEKIR
jgi:hypothetical protein